MLEFALLFFFPFFMVYSAASDILTMTIPNQVSLLLIAGFFVLAVAIGLDMSTILWHLAAFAAVLFGGFALFAIGQMGAGDVKLSASTALWLGWSIHLVEYLILFSFIGGVLVMINLFSRGRFVPEFAGRMEWFVRLYNSNKVPYGVALGAAGIMVYPSTVWMKSIIA